jgi:hypothetical protein
MQTKADLRIAWAHERIARAHRDAAWARLAEEARRRHRPQLRQRIGHAMIAAGRRLAAEPNHHRLARSS